MQKEKNIIEEIYNNPNSLYESFLNCGRSQLNYTAYLIVKNRYFKVIKT